MVIDRLSNVNYQRSIVNRSRAGTLALKTLNYQPIASGDARTTTINYQRSTINCQRSTISDNCQSSIS
ncbi:MAG: hypothetical protein HC849_15740 [Oscillatoriales cyanobacterium RU_3_3]|nr:hypothetical protein [Oscillatoriales cyanobacterium RU_3_3]